MLKYLAALVFLSQRARLRESKGGQAIMVVWQQQRLFELDGRGFESRRWQKDFFIKISAEYVYLLRGGMV